MHRFSLPLPTIMIAGLISCFSPEAIQAGEPVAKNDAAVITTEKASPWQISAGVTTRKVSTSFHTPATGSLNPRDFYRPQNGSGLGDVGLMQSPTDRIDYEDGFVGPDSNFVSSGGSFTDGAAAFQINSLSQYTPATTNFVTTTPGSMQYHSHGSSFSYAESYAGRSFNEESSDTGIGPYVNLRRSLWEGALSEAGLSLGWSFVQTSHSSGPQLTSRQTISETRRNSSYTYSYETLMVTLPGPVGLPYGSGAMIGVVYNPAAANVVYAVTLPRPLQSPTKTGGSHASTRTLAVIEAVSQSSLDLNFNDLSLLADWSFKPCSWCQVGLSAGPTLNFLDYDYDASTAWYLNGRNFTTARAHESGTEVKIGARLQMQAVCNLNKKGTFFLEFAGGYDWVDTAEVQLDGSKAEIDASSWTGRCGIGIRF
ncbi:MAG: hypothetical protein RL693_262 [Verrucomicrobiota bacterium]|jgi:hypothetical protein